MTHLKAACFLLIVFVIQACSTNPVTGKTQLSMPINQQIEIGRAQYVPAQQQQGGRYMVDPEVNLYVNKVGQKIATQSDVKLPYEFVVLNNDVPNAWALPGGKIAINRGLLVLLEDEAQLAAVLSHEIVHAAAEHGATQMRKSQILGLGAELARVASQDTSYGSAVSLGASVGAKAWQAHYGRSQELEADEYGIKCMIRAGYTPEAAVELQRTFVTLSKTTGKQDPISALFASHPPSQERVERNAARAARAGGGIRNKSAFQQALKQLFKDQPGYKKNAEAINNLQKGDFASANTSVNAAIAIQPKEALFYISKGQILDAQDKKSAAGVAFAKARKLNPDYFLPSLLHGLHAKSMGEPANAKSSLQASMRLLPTAAAAYHLGELALAEGNITSAEAYFSRVAEAGGEMGEKARKQLEKLQTSSK